MKITLIDDGGIRWLGADDLVREESEHELECALCGAAFDGELDELSTIGYIGMDDEYGENLWWSCEPSCEEAESRREAEDNEN